MKLSYQVIWFLLVFSSAHFRTILTLLGAGFVGIKYGRSETNDTRYFFKYSTKFFENLDSCNSY